MSGSEWEEESACKPRLLNVEMVAQAEQARAGCAVTGNMRSG